MQCSVWEKIVNSVHLMWISFFTWQHLELTLDFPLRLELRDTSAFDGQCLPKAQQSIAAVWISRLCAKWLILFREREFFLQINHLSIKRNPKNALTMIRVKFSGMEFVVRKFHRPMNRLWLKWMLQSNGPTSSTALCLNCHIFRLLIGCADTFLQIKWDFHSLHVQIGKCKSRWIKSYFCIPIKLSESMEYFSASFLLIPNTLATS